MVTVKYASGRTDALYFCFLSHYGLPVLTAAATKLKKKNYCVFTDDASQFE